MKVMQDTRSQCQAWTFIYIPPPNTKSRISPVIFCLTIVLNVLNLISQEAPNYLKTSTSSTNLADKIMRALNILIASNKNELLLFST
jgi:hypothetical protein